LTDRRHDRAARERETARILEEIGVTPAEASLFTVINYGITVPPDDLPRLAASEGYRVAGPGTEDGCWAALAACLAKGWLQVIDDTALARIAADLRGVVGPVYGLPPVGGIDFTPAGAGLWLQSLDRCALRAPGVPFAYTDVVHEKTARYYRTPAAAVAGVEEARGEEDVVSVRGPTPVGPWRAQWWRRFPAGYRVDVEARRLWKGHSSGGSEDCFFRRPPEGADARRLLNILDRHNVAAAEWAVLSALEYGPHGLEGGHLAGWAATSAEKELGAPLPEAEYRAGLDACLRYGWARVLDRNAVEEIHTLLRTDPAILAVPRTAVLIPDTCWHVIDPDRPGELMPLPPTADRRFGEVDFSPAGAALYRTISAEWLGPDWEDDLAVSNRYYWEEHHYCEAERGFRGIVDEYVAKGVVVRAARVVPLGPWCVWWWERFPAGYRLELEIDQPSPTGVGFGPR
jgi:hypothetical protein